MHQNKEEFDSFEKGIRDIFNGYEVPPAPHNWQAIASKIAPKSKKSPLLWLFFSFLVAISGSLLALATLPNGFNSLAVENKQSVQDKVNAPAPVVSEETLAAENQTIAYITESNEPEKETQNSILNAKEDKSKNAKKQGKQEAALALLNSNSAGTESQATALENDDKPSDKGKRKRKKAKAQQGNDAIKAASERYAQQRNELNILRKELNNLKAEKALAQKEFKNEASKKGGKKVVTRNSKTSIGKALSAKNNQNVNTIEEVSAPISVTTPEEIATSFLDDTTNYQKLAKISAIEEKKLKQADSLSQAIAATEKKLEEKLAKQSPYYIDVFFQPKMVYNSISLGNSGEEMATGLNASPSFARRFGFDIGTKAVFLLNKRVEFTAGINLNYMSQEVNYESLTLSNTPNPVGNMNGNTISGFSGGPLTDRQFRASSFSAGILAGSSVYLDSDQRIRISFLAGYQLPLSYQATLTVNGEQTAIWNNTRNARGVPSISLGSGYRARLGQGLHLIVEPMATLYLGNLNKVSGPVNVRPYAVGLNTILRFRSF